MQFEKSKYEIVKEDRFRIFSFDFNQQSVLTYSLCTNIDIASVLQGYVSAAVPGMCCGRCGK